MAAMRFLVVVCVASLAAVMAEPTEMDAPEAAGFRRKLLKGKGKAPKPEPVQEEVVGAVSCSLVYGLDPNGAAGSKNEVGSLYWLPAGKGKDRNANGDIQTMSFPDDEQEVPGYVADFSCSPTTTPGTVSFKLWAETSLVSNAGTTGEVRVQLWNVTGDGSWTDEMVYIAEEPDTADSDNSDVGAVEDGDWMENAVFAPDTAYGGFVAAPVKKGQAVSVAYQYPQLPQAVRFVASRNNPAWGVWRVMATPESVTSVGASFFRARAADTPETST